MVLKRVNKTNLSLIEGNLFRDGKRHAAARATLRTFSLLKKGRKQTISTILHTAFDNSYPYVTLRAKKVGGSVYQIPIHLPEFKQNNIASKWLASSCGTKLGGRISCLSKEVSLSLVSEGTASQKKKALHLLAVGNRAYIKYL